MDLRWWIAICERGGNQSRQRRSRLRRRDKVHHGEAARMTEGSDL
jgi:hypothetical protein